MMQLLTSSPLSLTSDIDIIEKSSINHIEAYWIICIYTYVDVAVRLDLDARKGEPSGCRGFFSSIER